MGVETDPAVVIGECDLRMVIFGMNHIRNGVEEGQSFIVILKAVVFDDVLILALPVGHGTQIGAQVGGVQSVRGRVALACQEFVTAGHGVLSWC